MNTIDQRILIPSPQSAVWEYLSDLTRNPQWMVDCQSVSFLTTKRQGTATRFRVQDGKGKESIVEVSAWYNGLGYEYVFIDGSPYRENRGRLRLQEIPEGTIVQWTFHYDIGGMFSGVRNPGRQIETTMANSLKNLYRQITQQNREIRDSKSLMRDAPDVRARSQYQPRYPTSPAPGQPGSGQDPVQVPPTSTAEFMLSELEMQLNNDPFAPPPVRPDDAQVYRPAQFDFDAPPVVESDTRPNPVVQVPADAKSVKAEPDLTTEPDFLDDLFEDARFAPPVDETVSPQATFDFAEDNIPLTGSDPVDAALLADLFEDVPVTQEEPARLAELVSSAPAVDAPDPFSFDEPPATSDIEVAAATPVDEPPAEPVALPKALEPVPVPPPPEPEITEESFKSIWEVFGVERPSESQKMRAITDQQIADAERAEAEAARASLETPTSAVTETLPGSAPVEVESSADAPAETVPGMPLVGEAHVVEDTAANETSASATEAVTAPHDLVARLEGGATRPARDEIIPQRESAIETTPLEAVVPGIVTSASTSAEPSRALSLEHQRIGLRIQLRKRLVRLRHPV